MSSLSGKGNFGGSPHLRRHAREAEALAVVKAMRKSPSAPEPAEKPLQPTRFPDDDPAAPSVVYFVYCAGRIKIGYTTDIRNRMAGLASSSPAPITLLLTIPGNEQDEARYHRMFASDRVHLEWFRLSYGLREFLDSHFDPETFPLLFEAECDHLEASRETTAYISEVIEVR